MHFPFDKICSTGSLATCTTVKRTTSASRTNCCHSSVFRCIFPGFMIVHCCVLFLICVSCLKDSTQPLQNIYLNLHKVSSINKNISKLRSNRLVNHACSVLILPIHPLISLSIHPSIYPSTLFSTPPLTDRHSGTLHAGTSAPASGKIFPSLQRSGKYAQK